MSMNVKYTKDRGFHQACWGRQAFLKELGMWQVNQYQTSTVIICLWEQVHSHWKQVMISQIVTLLSFPPHFFRYLMFKVVYCLKQVCMSLWLSSYLLLSKLLHANCCKGLHLPRYVLQMYSAIWLPDLLDSAKWLSSRFNIRLNWKQIHKIIL